MSPTSAHTLPHAHRLVRGVCALLVSLPALLFAATAAADAVPPPPASCLEGAEGDSCHGGPFCKPRPCADVSACKGNETCEERMLCIGVVNCAGGWGPPDGGPFVDTVEGSCAGEVPCANGACKAVKVCGKPGGGPPDGGAPDAGPDAGGTGGGGAGAGAAGGSGAGAGPAGGGGATPVAPPAAAPAKADDGCGCRLGAPAPARGAWWLLLAAAGLFAGRRRTREVRRRIGLGLVGVVLLAALAACGDSKSKYRGDGDGGSGGGGSGGAGASGGGSGESPLVPGGTYFRSYDGVDYQDKSFPATVSDFRLDTYEVTVGRFRAFVEAGKGTQLSPPAPGDGMHPKIVNSGWNAGWNGALTENTKALKTALTCENHGTWTDSPGNDEKLPINCVTWYEAFAFCAWDGGRLPTEAEWNYAAAGGAEQRYFPWSSPPSSTTIDPSYAVYGGNDIEPVGSKPNGNGRWGQVDLGGSMSEWTLDGGGDYPLPCNDCASLVYGPYRVFRGGGWGSDASFLRSAYRLGFDASSHGYDAGFRCARTP